MKTQKTTHNMKRAVYSGSLALTLASIIGAAAFAFPAAAWSQTAEWTVYNTTNSGMPYNGVIALAIDAQENVWVGTGKWYAFEGGGLAKFDGQNWTVYNTANSGLPNNDHTGLAIDDEGNVWIGTEGGTLTKFDGKSWTVYRHPISSGQLASPCFEAQGNIWVGSYGGGLTKFDGVDDWTVYTTGNSGLPHNRAWATAFDAQENLWIGTFGGGLAKFDGRTWRVYNVANSGLPHNNVGALSFDAQGNLWMGTGGGVAEFDGENWKVYNTANSGLANDNIGALAVGVQGNIWAATGGGGLARFDGKNWTVYDTANSPLPDNSVYSLAIDAQGSVWIGTESGGLAVYRPRPGVDFNGDEIVDIKDLLILIEYWGQDEPSVDIGPPPFGDGIVDVQDLEVLMSYWQQEILPVSLLAYWKLDEAEGSIAHDSAGDKDGTVHGDPLWQPTGGQIAGALAFDGIDDYVSTPLMLDTKDAVFSVFAWIKGGAPAQVILSQIGQADWLCADPSGGNLMTELEGIGRTACPLVSQTLITDGGWHRVGLTWDGSNRILYADDVEAAKDTQAQLGASAEGLYIGAGKNLEAGSFFSGLIDDVRIYDRAITP